MRVRDPPIFCAVFYFILFSSLVIHEAAHVYAAQHISKNCMFLESRLQFDLLVVRRGGMTYFTCSHGVDRYSEPSVSLNLEDPTLPTLEISVAMANGIRQLTSPLTTGWFTALMGPAVELLYVTWMIHWLSRRYRRIHFIKASYLVFLLMVFVSSRLDFLQAAPKEHTMVYTVAYFFVFLLVAMTHITFNTGYYRGLIRSTAHSMKKKVTIKC